MKPLFVAVATFVTHHDSGLYNLYVVDPSAREILVYTPAADGVGFPGANNWLDAPRVAFYGVGNETASNARVSFLYRTTTVGGSARIRRRASPISTCSICTATSESTCSRRSAAPNHRATRRGSGRRSSG